VVIIYAGAIMVLVLFVIMLLQRSPREIRLLSEWGPAALLGAVFLAVAVGMVFKDPGSGIVLKGAVAQPRDFGRFLFDKYWLAVEIVSLLFLVALVAIIQLGKRKEGGDDEADRRVTPPGNSSGVSDPTAEQRSIISNGVKQGHR
jgi:NADH-quinone oxidoreductase subunit J